MTVKRLRIARSREPDVIENERPELGNKPRFSQIQNKRALALTRARFPVLDVAALRRNRAAAVGCCRSARKAFGETPLPWLNASTETAFGAHAERRRAINAAVGFTQAAGIAKRHVARDVALTIDCQLRR